MSPRTGPRVHGSELEGHAEVGVDLAGGRRCHREPDAEIAEREVECVDRPYCRTGLAARGERGCLGQAADVSPAVHVHGAGDAVDYAPSTVRMREGEHVPGAGPARAGHGSLIEDLGTGLEQREQGLRVEWPV